MDFAVVVEGGPGAEPAEVTVTSTRIDVPNSRAGTEVEFAFTGGHLLHLAVAGCVLNDLYREAQAMGLPIEHARVTARGGFAGEPVTSTGITYELELESPAPAAEVERLVARVDEVAEIPSALRAGMDVTGRRV